VTDSIIRLYDTATGKSPPSLDLGKTTLSLMAFSRDGKRFVTVDWDNAISVWDAKTGKKLRSFPGPKDSINELAVSPDGRRVATYDGGGLVAVLAIESDGMGTPAAKEDGTVKPEKSRNDYVKIWDVEKGRPIRTFNPGSGFPFLMEFTPNGRSILTSHGWP